MEQTLEAGIRCFNVESSAELERLNEVAAAHGAVAPVSLRVNPDVDANTHPYISTGLKENKFGIPVETALDAYQQAADAEHLRIEGVDCHIGSQLTEIAPFVDALDRVLELVQHIEDRGIDAASFWQHLFFRYMPSSYEETRDWNPVDFLASGIFAGSLLPGRRLALYGFACIGCHNLVSDKCLPRISPQPSLSQTLKH